MINKLTTDLNHIQALNDEPNDVTGLTPTQLKTIFDQAPNEIKTYINSLVDILNSTTDGSSGADNIGATSITDLDGATTQAILESIRNKLKSVTDGSSGADFINATPIDGLTGTTPQTIIKSLKLYVDTYNSNHKLPTSIDHDNRYYTESEIDNNIYTKTQSDNNYYNKTTSYNKTEIDSKLQGVVLGQIPSNSLTEDVMANDMKKDIVGGITSYNTFASHLADTMTYTTVKPPASLDSNGIYTEVDLKRHDGTLIMKSVLSGGTSPAYATRTETYYAQDGITVTNTVVYTETYDTDGNVSSEVMN